MRTRITSADILTNIFICMICMHEYDMHASPCIFMHPRRGVRFVPRWAMCFKTSGFGGALWTLSGLCGFVVVYSNLSGFVLRFGKVRRRASSDWFCWPDASERQLRLVPGPAGRRALIGLRAVDFGPAGPSRLCLGTARCGIPARSSRDPRSSGVGSRASAGNSYGFGN